MQPSADQRNITILDLMILTISCLAFFSGGLIKGVVGMGLPLTSVALMTQVVDLRIAVPLLVIPILATNFFQAIRGGNARLIISQYWSLMVPACVFTFAGVYILMNVDTALIIMMLGTVITVYALVNIFAFRVRVSQKYKIWLSPVTGTAAGLMAGMTGVIAIPTIIYFQALGLKKDLFVQALGITFFIGGIFLLLALWQKQILNLDNLPISALAMLPAIAGMYMGEKIRRFIPEDRFRIGVFLVLAFAGLNLVRKALF